MRVLVVDDNELNVELFTDVLEGEGHEVSVARDGRAGHDLAMNEPFDLILMDIQLPQIDGVAVCRLLRAAGMSRPILAVSSAALPEQVRLGSEAGFDAYLTKPISPTALRAAVRRYQPS